LTKKQSTRAEIERIEQQREDRRKKMMEAKNKRSERQAKNENEGIRVDVEFDMMMEQAKLNVAPSEPHVPADQLKISVNVKKRPIFPKEQA
jgi:hypothetical protein